MLALTKTDDDTNEAAIFHGWVIQRVNGVLRLVYRYIMHTIHFLWMTLDCGHSQIITLSSVFHIISRFLSF